MSAWEALPAGVRIRVRLTPKADRDAVSGQRMLPDGHALDVRVRAVPEDGKANAALIGVMAKAIGVAPSAIRLERGATSRSKTLFVTGDPVLLAERLTAACGDTP